MLSGYFYYSGEGIMTGQIRTTDKSVKRAALVVITMASFLFPFMGSAVNVAIPYIGEYFNMDVVTTNWIATSFLLAAAVLSVPFGRLADIFGRRKLFVWGLIGYTVTSFLCGMAWSTEILLIARVLQGISGSMYSGAAMAIIISVFEPGERGRALGITTASVYLGLSFGPFIGGLLIQKLSWRSIFLITVPVCLFILFLILLKIKGEWAEAKGERFDMFGSLLYAIIIFSFVYGFSILPGFTGTTLLIVFIVSMLIFIYWENRQEYPILDLKLFTQNRTFAFSNLAALINYCSTFAVIISLSMYLKNIKSLDPLHVGLILVTQPICQALLSPTAGKLSDRIDPRIVASIGIGIIACGLFLFTGLEQDTDLPHIILALAVLGVGYAFFSSPNANAIMSSIPRKYLGVGSSVMGTMRITGQTLSMSISTLIFSIYVGNKSIVPETYPAFMKSIRVAFTIFMILSILAVFASLARGKSEHINYKK